MMTHLYKDLYDFEDKHWWHISKRQACIQLIKKYLSQPGLKILDIGCGTGKNVETFASLGQAWGIDKSKNAINYCHKRGLKTIQKSNVYRIPFAQKKFDLITLLDVLEHVAENKALNEIKRVLKNNGYLILTVPAYYWLWNEWDVILDHKRRYTREILKNTLINNGFQIKKISYIYSFLILPVFIVRFIKSINCSEDYVSDFKLTSNLINMLMLFLCSCERWFWLRFGLSFGTSIICVAQKK